MNDLDPRQELRRLLSLQATGLLSSEPPPEFQEICQRARERFRVGTALVTLVDRARLVIRAADGGERGELPRSDAFCDHTIRSDAVLVVPDLGEDPRFAANPLVVGPPFFRFYAGAPLTYLRGVRLGALCIVDARPRPFSLGDQAELAQMADEVVTLIARQEFDGRPHLAVP